MNKQMTIQEGNRLIAEFMGSKYINDPYKANKGDNELTDFWHWTKPDCGWPVCKVTGTVWSTAFMIENFKYHASWDWLMPVVEKIQNMEDEFTMRFGFYVMVNIGMRSRYVHCEVENWRGKVVATSSGQKTLIECVYQTVLQFINWYNTTNK